MRIRRVPTQLSFLIMSLILLAWPPPLVDAASTGEKISFRSGAPAQPIILEGFLYRPQGPGPFPAMVLLHTCGGLAHYNQEYGDWFMALGNVALVVDSFSARHQTNVCGKGQNPSVNDVAGDALGALTFLRTQPFVDGGHVGVIGWSYGAMAALRVSSRSFVEAAHIPGGGFRVAVSLYPDCRLLAPDISIPLLLLLGGADNWTPPGVCEARAPELQRAGQVVEWHTYAGVHHAFDNDGLGSRTETAQGRYTLKFDPAAAADAHSRIQDFLARYLRGP